MESLNSGVEGRSEKQSAEKRLVIKINGKFEHLIKTQKDLPVCAGYLHEYAAMPSQNPDEVMVKETWKSVF